ncbi:MAG: alpha-L-fucosidase [Akkermansiaceae bacterium]
MLRKITCSIISSVLCLTPAIGQKTEKLALPESDEAYEQRMEWFTDAQFGLFIHYGLYSSLGGEWKGKSIRGYAEWIQRWGRITPEEYIPLAKQFNPSKLDADLWVKTAKEAGMTYMVITTKHHEGFCLWDSAHTEYDTGEGAELNRDILAELKKACDKYGLKFGTYYSIIDWHHPSQIAKKAHNQPKINDKEAYVKYMKAQLKELIDNYDPAIMWFDGDWVHWWTMEDGLDLYNYLRELSPEMIINNRVAKRREFVKDYGTPENSTPGAALDHIWEACWTVNHSWGYKQSDTTWKSIDLLVQKQIDINTKGGNLLLNVGPYADGSWPDGSTVLLQQMGEWNKAHYDAVYDIAYLNAIPQHWGKLAQSKASTPESGEIFAYIFDWPSDGKLSIKGVSAKNIIATSYDGTELSIKNQGANLQVDLNSLKAHPQATVLRIKYSGGLILKKDESDSLKLEGNELILEAKQAKISGNSLTLKDSSIRGWGKDDGGATWSLNVPAPSKYEVKILYSSSSKFAAQASLTVGSQSASGKVQPTGDNKKFKVATLGEVTLNQVGTTTCELAIVSRNGKSDLSIKNIYFVPVPE